MLAKFGRKLRSPRQAPVRSRPAFGRSLSIRRMPSMRSSIRSAAASSSSAMSFQISIRSSRAWGGQRISTGIARGASFRAGFGLDLRHVERPGRAAVEACFSARRASNLTSRSCSCCSRSRMLSRITSLADA
jgi:hypothetical protein